MKKLLIFLIPIFLLFISCNEEKKVSEEEIVKQVEYIKKSVEYNNSAINVINSSTSLKIKQNQINEYTELLKKAVNEAKKVDTSVLNEVKSGYGNIYTNKYIKSLEHQIKGYESKKPSLAMKGQILYDKYVDWIEKEGLQNKISNQ